MRENKILPGLFLILIAAVMMGSALGLIPDIPWFKLLVSTVLATWAIKALWRRDFFGAFMSVGVIAWIFEEDLLIEHLTPFPLLAAAALAGIGMNMIFGKKHKVMHVEFENEIEEEEWVDGRQVILVNNFNSTSKYVNSAAFSSANLENNFGSVNVYFNNATVYEKEAKINLSNNFGRMNVYLPNKWRATVSQDSTFGHVTVHGEPNRDMDAPHVIIKADSNFGELNIFFD